MAFADPLRGARGEKVLELRAAWMGHLVAHNPSLAGLPAASGIKAAAAGEAEEDDVDVEVVTFGADGEVKDCVGAPKLGLVGDPVR